MNTEIIFIVEQDPDGGFNANAVGASIFTQADTPERRTSIIDTLLKQVRREVESRLVAIFERKLIDADPLGPDVVALVDSLRDLTMRGGKRFRPALLVAREHAGVEPGNDLAEVLPEMLFEDAQREALAVLAFEDVVHREDMCLRIDRRVEAMFAQGLVGEVEGLLNRYRTLSHTAAQAVGYREVLEHLHDLRNLKDTIELTKLRTRQFAKRQMTWFRGLSECRFVPLSAADDIPGLALKIAAEGQMRVVTR